MTIEKPKNKKYSDGRAENRERLKQKGMESWPEDIEKLNIEALKKATAGQVEKEPGKKEPEEEEKENGEGEKGDS